MKNYSRPIWLKIKHSEKHEDTQSNKKKIRMSNDIGHVHEVIWENYVKKKEKRKIKRNYRNQDDIVIKEMKQLLSI